MRPAVEAAAAWLAGRSEPARAIGIVSDGRDPALAVGADREAVAATLAALAARGATAAALCAGPAPDLRALVADAGGRLADLGDFRGLRELLTRELRHLRADPEWRGPAAPACTEAGRRALGAVGGIEMPPVIRAARTILAPDAETWIGLPGGPPLLAARRAGLGRTLAFTASPRDGYAPAWAGAAGRRLLRQAVEAVRPRRGDRPVEARATTSGESVRLDVRWVGPAPADGRALAVDDGGQRRPLRPTGPGTYAVELPAAATARLAAILGDAGVLATVPLPGARASEWEAIGPDVAACERLARLTGGRVLADAALWRPDPARGATPRSLDGWWLAFAVATALAAFVVGRGRAGRRGG